MVIGIIMISQEIKDLAKRIYDACQPYCISIYYGGSRVNKYIKNPGDYDFILFGRTPEDMCHIRRVLFRYLNKNSDIHYINDFSQVRNKEIEEHSYGSYINNMMIKLVGEDIEFKFDIIDKNREEYKQILKETIVKLNEGKIKNQKRWYQIYQGLCIMNNNSYELTEKQIKNINILHDKKEGSKEIIEEIKLWQI